MPTLTLTFDKPTYVKGEQITATLALAGADDVPARTDNFPATGKVTVDGAVIQATSPFSVFTPAVTHTRTGHQVTAAGYTFTQTANPNVFTATA